MISMLVLEATKSCVENYLCRSVRMEEQSLSNCGFWLVDLRGGSYSCLHIFAAFLHANRYKFSFLALVNSIHEQLPLPAFLHFTILMVLTSCWICFAQLQIGEPFVVCYESL